jgi:dihydroorotate dehydrogenase/Pyruvate/2-oxoacid:ferredoxin oxidoreductase delta subunit
MANLSVAIGELKFKNPILNASGPIAHGSAQMERAIRSGLGGVVTKTCTSTPYFRTYPRMEEYLLNFKVDPKNVWAHDTGNWRLYHRDHLQHQEPEVWAGIIKKLMPLAREHDCRVIGSIEGGTDMEAWKYLAKIHEEAGVDAFEINCCCPHPSVVSLEYTYGKSAIGMATGKSMEATVNAVKAVKSVSKLPMFVKLTPEAEDPTAIAKAAFDAGAAGATVISRNLALNIDIETAKIIGYGYCSTSGPGTKELALRWVAATKMLGVPILGSNGPVEPADFIEFMMAGATCVQSCTALMVYGYRYVEEILKWMNEFLDRRGLSAKEIIGKALPVGFSVEVPKLFKAKYGEVDHKKCNGCKRCEEACFYEAINISEHKMSINPNRCVGCNFCHYLCPQQAISYTERDSEEGYVAALRANV